METPVEYRSLCADEITRELFSNFVRRQRVTKCWSRESGAWKIKNSEYIEDWSEADYQVLVDCLKNTAASGGLVYAAFCDEKLKGFASVEPELFGGEQKYLELSSLHVSEDMRGGGIGTVLFAAAKAWAKKNGARRLYISSNSAAETQAFYQAMECEEARSGKAGHAAERSRDRQLECKL